MMKEYVDVATDLLNSITILKEAVLRSIESSNNPITKGRLEYCEIKMLKDDISDVIADVEKLKARLDNKLFDNVQSDISTLNNRISLHTSAHDIFGGC